MLLEFVLACGVSDVAASCGEIVNQPCAISFVCSVACASFLLVCNHRPLLHDVFDAFRSSQSIL